MQEAKIGISAKRWPLTRESVLFDLRDEYHRKADKSGLQIHSFASKHFIWGGKESAP